MSGNGQSKHGLIVPPPLPGKEPQGLICHRMYVPVSFAEANPLNPQQGQMKTMVSNVFCIKEKCTLWNGEKLECRDVTDSKSRALVAEHAFNKMNDVSVETGGM